MTDKPKTIQEALAKVQRNVDEDFNLPDLKKIKAAGAAAKQKISDVAQGVSDYINRPVKYNPDQPTIGTQGTNHPANVPASTVFDKIKSGQSPASTPATPKTEPAKTETPPKQETPKTEPAKTETPPAGSSAAKMSFNQAYAKAREMAKAAGKNPNIAQFKWGKDGGPEKTYQAAETKADYVTKNKQFAVDINAPSSTKKLVDAPLPPKRETIPVGTVPSSRGGTAFPADATGMPPATTRNIPAGSEGAKYPAEGGVRQAATGTFEKGEGYATIREPKKPETESGKKKMSEEHINELSKFGAAFAAARRAGQSEFSFGGKSFNTRLASSSPSKPSGPQGAPGLVGPGAKVTRLDAPLPPSRPNTQGPRQPAEQGAPIPKTDKVPGSSTGDATPRPSTTPPINQTQQKPLQSVDTSAGQDSDIDGTMRAVVAPSGSTVKHG